MQFTKAILRKPGNNFSQGITTASLGMPDTTKALEQHARYASALEACGLVVTILDADERYPDGCFVEDTAIITPKAAFITCPGNPSRRGETTAIQAQLATERHITVMQDSGTLDGGDVLAADGHYWIGLSKRTNLSGAEQLSRWLEDQGYTTTLLPVNSVLHLKTGMTYLGRGQYIGIPEFEPYVQLLLHPAEAYAANCMVVNQHLFIPAGYPSVMAQIEALNTGYTLHALEMSEFEKMDGGLTCLSLLL